MYRAFYFILNYFTSIERDLDTIRNFLYPIVTYPPTHINVNKPHHYHPDPSSSFILHTSTPTTTMPPPTTPTPTPKKPTEANNKPVYFWRPHTPNGYLSQWYSSPFTLNGETYATAEMWMMVQKARLFKDEAVALKMLGTTDPRRHKALGRQVKGFSEGVWDDRTFIFFLDLA